MDYYIYGEIGGLYGGIEPGSTIHVNSGGGNVFSGIALYNLIKNLEVKIVVEGLAASAATLILCGGRVKAARGSIYMLHNPLARLDSSYTAEELERLRNSLDAVRNSVLEVYESKLKLSRDEISDLMDNETWLSAEDARAIGLIDEIDEDLEVKEMSAEGKLLMQRYNASVIKSDRAAVMKMLSLKGENAVVDALIDVAIMQGDTLERLSPYLEAVKALPSPKFAEMLEDNLTSGSAGVVGSTPELNVQAEMLSRYMKGLK